MDSPTITGMVPGWLEECRVWWRRWMNPKGAARQKNCVLNEFDLMYRDNPPAALLAKAMWLTGCGQLFAASGRFFPALDHLSEAVTLHGDYIPAYLGLASTYRCLGQSAGSWSAIGQALDILRRLPRRLNLLGSEIQLEDFSVSAYYEWARVRIVMGDHQGAANDLRKALAGHQAARAQPKAVRAFLTASGCRLDQEYAEELRQTLAEIRL